MLEMKKKGSEVDHKICKPIKGKSFDNTHPGIFGYTPIGLDNGGTSACFKKRVTSACYAGMRTATYNGKGT